MSGQSLTGTPPDIHPVVPPDARPRTPLRSRRRWFATLAFAIAAATGLALGGTGFTPPTIVAAVTVTVLAVVTIGLVAASEFDRRTLEREVRCAQQRSAEAGDRERRRIQRDLHDSAQQRLIAVRIRLGLLAGTEHGPGDHETIEQLGREVDEALAEIRSITRDGAPQSLDRLGVPAALAAVTASAPGPVAVEVDGWGRYDAQIERTVYFCCVEALQNVWKHAGSGARPLVRLRATRGAIAFDVEDSGGGFDPSRVQPGGGLLNIADRVEAVRGRASVHSVPGGGTRISGRIPIDRAA